MKNEASDNLARDILIAYPQGAFPMAEARDDPDYAWYRPHERGIMPVDGFHISKTLSRFARKNAEYIRFMWDGDFEAVIDACAARETTWINAIIRDAFLLLHAKGYTHSFEVYYENKLAGGVYGLAMGGVFFGESMFSHQTNASKLALGAMIYDLRERGFTLYDTQFITPHLQSLGGIEISNEEYMARLKTALERQVSKIEAGELDLHINDIFLDAKA